jgi:hypothetical protein
MEVMDMQTQLHIVTTVMPGKRVEFTAPELIEGETVELSVVLSSREAPAEGSILKFLESLPPGPRGYSSWEDLDREFQAERDAWDR